MRTPLTLLTAATIGLLAAGCPPTNTPHTPAALLPQRIRLHPFTGTRQFAAGGGVRGIEARVETIDHFGDANKAFGVFRFEAYKYVPRQSESRGMLLATWASDLTDPQKNFEHWDSLSRTYRFRLKWDKPVPVGKKFVLRAILSSPDGPRLFDQQEFIAGQ